MHAYLITRGIKHEVERWANDLSGKYLPTLWKDPLDPNKISKQLIQVAVRPIQLWEVVFPEEYKDLMLSTLFGKCDVGGEPQPKLKSMTKHQLAITALRKVLGVEKLPKMWKDDNQLPVYCAHMEKIAIGIKKDRYEIQDGQNVEML